MAIALCGGMNTLTKGDMMIRTARCQGKWAIGRAVKDGREIYAFRVWGKIMWSGDLEHFRATKAEAYAEALPVSR